MTSQTEALRPEAELVLEQRLSRKAAEIEAVLANANGDPRIAVGALLVRLAEVERARLDALQATSTGYRRGLPPRRSGEALKR